METTPQSHLQGESKGGKRSLRLLVVEDHQGLRWVLQAFFAMHGHRAHFVENMESAVRAADEKAYDVLLCDIDLPDGNGWDLLRQLERTGHRPPHAIAMSVFNLGEHVAKSKEAGYALHLFKPFAPMGLEAALGAAPA